MNDAEQSALRDAFLVEFEDHLTTMEDLLVDGGMGSPETIDLLFRAIHSIKGSAGIVGLVEVQRFAHGFETLIERLRRQRQGMTPEVVDVLLEGVDVLRGLAEPDVEPDAAAESVLRRIRALSTGGASEPAHEPEQAVPSDPPSSSTVRIVLSEQALVLGVDPNMIIASFEELGQVDVRCNTAELPSLDALELDRCYLSWDLEVSGDVDPAALSEVAELFRGEASIEVVDVGSRGVSRTPRVGARKPSGEGATIRVGLAKIDALMNLVGELVITQSMLKEVGDRFDVSKLQSLRHGLDRLAADARGIQESVTKIRMLPVSSVLHRLPRIMRDLTRTLGKDIELVFEGEHTEVDVVILDALSDPLVHLLRNSADHGIESPEERLRAGKPAAGTIRIAVFQQGGHVHVTISDDGRGIDRAALLAKARELGIVHPGETPTEAEIDRILFHPGVSTSRTVTEVSGRGVGMDVVASNVERLGGTVTLTTTRGQGTTFAIRLPLTLAILEGQLLTVSGETFVVPLLSMRETQRLDSVQVRSLPGGGAIYRLRDRDIPLVPTARILSLPPSGEADIVVVVDGKDGPLGLVVDELLGQQQVVVKRIADNFRSLPGISAATILGNGMVAMILDVRELGQLAADLVESSNVTIGWNQNGEGRGRSRTHARC